MIRLLGGIAAAFALWLFSQLPADAMPPFAEAYSANCSLCHTQVPALNAHGRYVQRAGYDPLNHRLLKRASPVWVGVNASYDSADPRSVSQQFRDGNVAVHVIGATGDWSYHVQQWLVQGNAPGGLDTAWVSYNKLFQRSGHLFLGKVEAPAPSPFSQWFDLASITSAEVTVGEHTYQIDNNRWGAKFAFVRGALDAEAAWLGSSSDLDGLRDFSNDTDKTVQYKVARATERDPLEYGYYGSRGSFPLPEGGVDNYSTNALYVQRDPHNRMPGVFALYQTTHDDNPGLGDPAATGNDAMLELYQPILHGNALVGVRKEFTNDGLGTSLQTGNLDFEYHLARFVHIYAETYMQQDAKPGYRYMLWWTMPTQSQPR